ncbi:MutS domain protein, family 5 [hydrothermal vent metagenome]|uniref:MutS domain protein, family 5 n=1 Tax=hydrothermal vent metagenome TaxID=652676 RepID=A0A3B0TLI3_9ZZZZ
MEFSPFNASANMANADRGQTGPAQKAPLSGQPRAKKPQFISILGAPEAAENWRASTTQPEYFEDLNLDQIVLALISGRDEYDLAEFFYTPLTSVEAIDYRLEVFGDLENKDVLAAVNDFCAAMRLQRRTHTEANELYQRYQKEILFVDGVEIYTEALLAFSAALSFLPLKSAGLKGLRIALERSVKSQDFRQLVAEIAALKAALAKVKYTMQIRAGKVIIRKPADEIDYGARIEKTFARFKRHASQNYLVSFPQDIRMNSLEERVLVLVGKLYPETFARLDGFRARYDQFIAPFIARYDREIQFYLAMIEQMAYLKRTAGLSFCHPRVSATDKAINNQSGFDLALAIKLAGEEKPLVCNDFFLKGAERIIVVSGPNQGGKTTFARSFGQLCFLASLGLPVPGTGAHIFLFDQMFTQFERAEDVTNLRSKLEDDLKRIHAILQRASGQSVIVLNEIFSSTTLNDQRFLSAKVFEQIIALDALCLSVTFLDELSHMDKKTVSMVSTIVADDPSQRTFKIERRPANGLAYALAVAKKYHLTYQQLNKRLGQ